MSQTQDDAFREIQLSGKQLVFLFMAVVVIAVVIFLSGVQVGRGVRAERGLPEGTDAAVLPPAAEPPPPPASASQGPSGAPITSGEKLSYAERLGSAKPAPETLKPVSPPPDAPTPRAETPDPKPAPPPAPVASASAPAPPVPAGAASNEPAGSGYAIQVAALRERSEAESIAKRLSGKGYPAYVMAPAKGAPAVYRVRVGKFKERREADSVAARLQKEEQFKPWVVR